MWKRYEFKIKFSTPDGDDYLQLFIMPKRKPLFLRRHAIQQFRKWEKGRGDYDKRCKILNLDIVELSPAKWCLGWFKHWTYDEEQSDIDLTCSFERYVNSQHRDNLMGAEERWRWLEPRKDGGIAWISH